jgi:hypothetical protein
MFNLTLISSTMLALGHEDYRQEFMESFPELDEIKCFIRKPKAIEDLVNHVTTILG